MERAGIPSKGLSVDGVFICPLGSFGGFQAVMGRFVLLGKGMDKHPLLKMLMLWEKRMQNYAGPFWLFVFVLLFLGGLHVPFWNRPPSVGWLGLPPFVFTFVGLQLLLAAALWGFSRTIWRETSEREEQSHVD